jgi:trehalose 6-phosphate synthase/phosphatase
MSPSSHPALPPSRAPSPTFGRSTGDVTPTLPSHRWILHPRRGHAALNAGLKSLRGSALTVVGRPDDMTRAGGANLGQGELGDAEKRDLESGLAAMSSKNHGEGIECVPVWLDDKIHTSKS